MFFVTRPFCSPTDPRTCTVTSPPRSLDLRYFIMGCSTQHCMASMPAALCLQNTPPTFPSRSPWWQVLHTNCSFLCAPFTPSHDSFTLAAVLPIRARANAAIERARSAGLVGSASDVVLAVKVVARCYFSASLLGLALRRVWPWRESNAGLCQSGQQRASAPGEHFGVCANICVQHNPRATG